MIQTSSQCECFQFWLAFSTFFIYICLQIFLLIPLWSSVSLFPPSLNCSVKPHFCHTTGAVASTNSEPFLLISFASAFAILIDYSWLVTVKIELTVPWKAGVGLLVCTRLLPLMFPSGAIILSLCRRTFSYIVSKSQKDVCKYFKLHKIFCL